MTPNVNLLPISFRRKQAARYILTRWALVGFVMSIALVTQWLHSTSGTESIGAKLAELSSEAGPIHNIKSKSIEIRRELMGLRKDWSVLEKLIPSDDALQTIGAVGVACAETGTETHVKSLELSIDTKGRLGTKTENNPKKKRHAKSPTNPSMLRLQIHATNDTQVAAFVDGLKSHSRFEGLELRSVGGVKNGKARIVELHADVVTSHSGGNQSCDR